MSHAASLPSYEFLYECFHLDPNDWKLYWKARPVTHFKNERIMNLWNGKFANKAAGKTDGNGYLAVNVHGKTYRSHRVIFFMHYGFQPSCIDHIDGNPKNNNPSNLREATLSQNSHNQKLSKRNTSGVKGVTWNPRCNKWQAQCGTKGKTRYLGAFNDLSDAEKAVKAWRTKMHGDFANDGVSP